ERQEDFAHPVLWDAAARIVHSYFDLSSGSTKRPLTHGNRQTAVSRHRLQSILNEISHGLPHQHFIHLNVWKLREADNADLGMRRLPGDLLYDFHEPGFEGHGLQLKFRLPGEVEKLRDDVVHVRDDVKHRLDVFMRGITKSKLLGDELCGAQDRPHKIPT